MEYSAKAYKARFKLWGFTKNLGADDIPIIINGLATMEKGQNTKQLLIRGKEINQAKAKRYLDQKKKHRTTLDKQGRRVTVSLQHRIDPPDDLQLPEAILRFSSHCIAGGIEGLWIRSPKSSPSVLVIDWLDNMFSVMNLLRQARYEQAFSILSTCFDRFKSLLIDPSPLLFVQIYFLILWLPPDIGQRLLGYAAQMSTIVLPANHPLILGWTKLHLAGIQRVVEISWLVLRSIAANVRDWAQDCTIEVVGLGNPTDVESTVAPWQTGNMRRLQEAQYVPRCQLLLTWVRYRSNSYSQVSPLRMEPP